MKIQSPPGQYIDIRSVLPTGTACAYDSAGQDYVAYADGDTSALFDFTGSLGFADRAIWLKLEAKLVQLATDGRRCLRILDAGCGPGTWLKRVILCAHELGFTRIDAVGVDISSEMVALATAAMPLDVPGLTVTIAIGDLTERLAVEDDYFDITLCLFGVLNHVPVACQPAVAAELARVTLDTCFVTVRTVGSLPTVYVDKLEKAMFYHENHETNWLDVVMTDGRCLGFPSRLFACDDLRRLFEPHLGTLAMFGLDVFHSRFVPDPAWNPARIEGQSAFEEGLDRLEQLYASLPEFINRAAHILLIGERGEAMPATMEKLSRATTPCGH
jgi:SAM-dependent methyltransferase